MNGTQMTNRLHRHMAAMVALEQTLGRHLEQRLKHPDHDPDLLAPITELRSRSREEHGLLAARLQVVALGISIPESAPAKSPLDAYYDGDTYPASAALLALYGLLPQAITGYAVLMVLARRAVDSSASGPENTDDIVQDQMGAYAAAAQGIARLLPHAVVDELERDGLECRCTCPSFGFGICLCAISTRRMLEMAWTDTGPVHTADGIEMVLHRSDSPAARVGLNRGDVLIAVAGQLIESIPMLQQSIWDHQSGETIHFQARRASGAQEEISTYCP